jgi:lipopolysaccharide export system permease protein
MPRIIQKYIRNEILSPFFFSLSVFTLVLFMQNALELSDMIIARGVNVTKLLQIILYMLPSLLWLSIPMAFLMATLIGLGRLSTDNEIIAMHSLGIGRLMFVRPVLKMGFLLFIFCFAIGNLGIPWGRSSMNQVIFQILRENATSGIQENIFNDHFTDLVIYAERVNPRTHTLHKVIIADYRGEFPETILANTGKIHTASGTMTNTMSLTTGSVHQFDAKTGRYRLIHFREYSLSLSKDLDSTHHVLNMSEKNPADMSLTELQTAAVSGDPEKRRTFQVHYQEKFALPFSCLVFGLFSIPFGIRIKKSGKFIGFFWSLLILFLYYILLGVGRNIGAGGMVHPVLAAWMPNLTFGLLGLYLLLQSSRRIPKGLGSRRESMRIKETIQRLFGS